MLTKIIGFIWVLMGIVWVIRPGMLKNRLQKKMGRKARWVVYGFIIVFGFLMIGSVLKAPGIAAKVVGVAGMALTIKAIMLLTSKTSEKFVSWWSQRPELFFRMLALVFFALGSLMLTVKY